MTKPEKIDRKKRLQKKCMDIIEARIANIRAAMDDAQSAANNEDKSSAGDKYETSRAMSHLEKEMQAKQLSSNMKEMESLLAIDCSTFYNAAEKGSFIKCKTISFFIAAGLGKLSFEDENIFLISPGTPLFKILCGKTTGDVIIFNKEEYTIEEVY